MVIEKVELRNWRNHVHWDGTFKPGINFVLGPNGSGKSSLLRAIQFALSGETQTAPKNEVHMGSREGASVSVTLNSSGQEATITRTIDQHGTTSESLVTNIEGTRTVSDLIGRELGAEGQELGRLLFLNEGAVYSAGAGDTGLATYLEQLLPLQSIRLLAANARDERKSLERTLRARRQDLRLSKEEEATLSDRRSQLETRLEEVEEEERGLRAKESLLAKQVSERGAQRQLVAAHDKWVDETRRLLGSLGMGELDIQDALERAVEESRSIRGQMRELATEVGRLKGENTVHNENVEFLTTGLPDECPLCHQELTEQHRSQLLADQRQLVKENNDAIESLEARLSEVEQRYDTWVETVDALRYALDRRPRPPADELSASTSFDDDLQEIRSRLQEIGAERRQAFDSLAGVREQLASSEADRRLEHEVTEAFRQNALLEALEHAVESFTSEVHTSLVTPLRDELSRQWKGFRPKAPWNLMLDNQGHLGIEMEGETRPYGALSAGEKTVAVVLLRLALAVAFTSSDFIVLDEPLEHLDPRTRRVLVSSLHHAVESGTIAQVVVSTYEEALVRRLQHDERANAIYLE